MKTIIKYIKLPLSFDAGKMLKEVYALADVWLAHYNSNDYTGEWKAIPLRSINGSASSAIALPTDSSAFRDTELMNQCPEIKSAINSFNCEKTSIRLLNLKPGAIVKEHMDPGLCYEEGEIRLHIPLVTNNRVEFYIDDEPVFPKEGECWYMNFDLKHRLANNGNRDRIHLVIDCIVNEWIHTLFADCDAADVKRTRAPERFSIEEKLMIIEELKKSGAEMALKMVKDIEEEIRTTQYETAGNPVDKNLLDQITGFIETLGISCRQNDVRRDSFLPGVDIVNGCIVYDPAKLLSPGDLLHEAGHMAVLLPDDRRTLTSPNVSGDLEEGGAEMAAIAWSWAALKHLGIPPGVVFHAEGYKDDSENIIANFNNGRYFGVSLLQWFGMTTEPRNAAAEEEVVYPQMNFWLRK